MGLFGGGRRNTPMNNVERTVLYVEKLLSEVLENPAQARMQDQLGWNIILGSANIEILIAENEQGQTLQVVAPLLHLPQTGLLPFYRRLLELNMMTPGITFGVYGDVVFLYNERPLEGLDEIEVRDIIQRMALNADKYDNELVQEFGGRLYNSV